jgi:membrane protease YdiL (CAAX protease family)
MQKNNREVRSAIGIGVVLIAIGFFSFAVSPIANLSQSFVFSMVASNIVVLGVSLGTFVILYKRPISQMGFALPKWGLRLLYGALVGIAAITVCFAVFVLAGWGKIRKLNFSSAIVPEVIFYAILFIFVGFAEETLTRGYLMTALKTTRNKWFILFAPAITFSVLHFSNPNFNPIAAINIFVIGIAFGMMFIQTGSLWMPIGYHITWNYFQGVVYGMPVSGIAAPSLVSLEVNGPEVLTGGSFGAEGGLICTFVSLAVIAVAFLFKSSNPAWTFASDLPLTRGRLKQDHGSESEYTSI